VSWWEYPRSIPYHAASAAINYIAGPHSDVYNKYTVLEPHNIVKRHDREDALPSSVLSTVPFPDESISGRYVPAYEKQQYLSAPRDLYPVYKHKKTTTVTVPTPGQRRVYKYNRYRRGRKIRR
jgi:hypothetical protein